MEENYVSDVELAKDKDEYSIDEPITINARFSIQGKIRDSFNEKNWTKAYNVNDNLFKIKYGVKLLTGSLRKHEIGKPVDTYRKASIFWTRNPKLVNPMKDRRVWVQVSKNFEPFIRLTEKEVQEELFDFDEPITFNASDLGKGTHKVSAEVVASWQKHQYTDPDNVKKQAKPIMLEIN